MLWIEFTCPTLTMEQKKNVATQITETLSSYFKIEKDMVGVQFQPYLSENLYCKGKFLTERPNEPMYHLHIWSKPLTREQKKELIHTTTDVVGKALSLPENLQRQLGVSISEIPLENLGMGGNVMAELTAAK